MSYIIKTRDDFLLDGVSALSFGLAVEMPQPVPMARQRYTTWQSGDTDISEPDDAFENVRYTITARRIKTPEDFRAADLYAALSSAKTLTLTRNTDRYFKIASVQDVSPTASAKGNELTYKITFMLSPFAYHTSNPETAPENNIITNPGTRYSRPLYKIVKSSAGSAASITVNQADTLQLLATSPQAVTVDAEHMIAFETAGTHDNCTRFTYGLFPFLAPGDNLITCNGCTVSVIGNWRDY